MEEVKSYWFYDVEVYYNFFCVTFKNVFNKEVLVFEISSRKNQLNELYSFIKQVKRLIGFNNKHYDNIILMYLYRNYEKIKTTRVEFLTRELKIISTKIIEDEYSEETKDIKKKYGYNYHFLSIDLFLYWSKMLRLSKKLSLKSIAININWPIIQELPIQHDKEVPLDKMDIIISYNLNDVNITEAVFNKLKPDINLRFAAYKKYGFKLEDVINWDGVKLGLEVLIKRYCNRTSKDYYEVKKLRTFRNEIRLSEIILPQIKFDKVEYSHRRYKKKVEKGKDVMVDQFENFYSLHKYLMGLTVIETSELNCEVLYKGVIYDVKSGGLHSRHTPEVIKPNLDLFDYIDIDVSSYYPTLGSMWLFIPEHLGKEFAEELESIRLERLDLKAKGLGKSDDANLLKLSMNGGFYGNTNNEHTPMFDRKTMFSITINGQLLLLMLAEKFEKIGVKVDMANTDGITIISPKEKTEEVRRIVSEWEKISRCQMEYAFYSIVVRNNINNYLAFHPEINGKIEKPKEKGMYLTNPPLDMSRDALIIPIALRAYFEKNIPIEETILNHKNIYDFCIAQKVDKSFSVIWDNIIQQNLNRYYVSKNGHYIFKSKDEGKTLNHMVKGWTVNILNNVDENIPIEKYNINYKYYISETRKIINNAEVQQGTLF